MDTSRTAIKLIKAKPGARGRSNGIVYHDGGWWCMCGDWLRPTTVLDRNGKTAVPKPDQIYQGDKQ